MRFSLIKVGLVVLTSVILAPIVFAQDKTVITRTPTEASPGGKTLLERVEIQKKDNIDTAQLNVKLRGIKDARKKELVKKISDHLCMARDDRVNSLNQRLKIMTDILARVGEKASAAQAKGKDITAVTTAVTNANQAISTAQSAVNDFSSSSCVLTISGDELKLGREAKSANQQLTNEVKAVGEKVAVARKAVGGAVQALARVLGEAIPQPVKENTTKDNTTKP